MELSISAVEQILVKKEFEKIFKLVFAKKKKDNDAEVSMLLVVDPALMKRIKTLVKSGGNYGAETCSDLLQYHLSSKSSVERYQALLIVNELFVRSKYFRILICRDIQKLIHLTGCYKHHNSKLNNQKIPLPKNVTKLLRKKGIEIIETWYENYGKFFKELREAFYHINGQLGGDGKTRRQLLEEKQAKQARKQQRRLFAQFLDAKNNILSKEPTCDINAIRLNLKEMAGCIQILVPSFAELFEDKDAAAAQPAAAASCSHPAPSYSSSPSSSSNHAVSTIVTQSAATAQVEEINQDDKTALSEGEDADNNDMFWDDDDDDSELSEEEESKQLVQSSIDAASYKPPSDIVITISKESIAIKRNAVVESSLKECRRLLEIRDLPLLRRWVQVLTEVKFAEHEDVKERMKRQCLRIVLELKEECDAMVTKCDNLSTDGACAGSQSKSKLQIHSK